SSRQWLPWAAAGWVVVVSSMLAWLVLERIPHIGDEWTYLFQAKHLALGQFWLPPPPDAEAFMVPLTYQDPTRWLNANMIGWPVVLSVGVRLGIPWMINPLLAGTAILLAHALVRRIYERTVADAVVLLMAASPWLLWISASLMSHALSLVLVLLVMLGVSRARQRGAVSWGAVAGSSCGALLHTRPLEAVVVALVAGVWWLAAGQRRLRVPAVAAAIVCGGAMVALFLAYNQSVTGNAFQTPLNAFYDAEFHKGSNRLGFGADIGNWGWIGLDALPGHGPIDVLMNTNQNLHMVQFDLFGWAFGSITLVYFLGVWRRRRLDAFMWVWLGGAIAGLNLYWFSGGPDFGARYWYMAIIPFTVLAVRGAQELSAHFVQIGRTAAASRVWAFVVLATAIGTTNLLVWRSLDKYLNYRGARPDIRRLATEHTFGRSLVLIRGRLWPNYGSAAPLNPIWLGNDGVVPIYARELTRESVAKLRAYYADRPVWIIAGPTATEPRFHVVAGPIAPGVPLPAAAQPEQSSADDQPRGPDDPPHRR
ncbi:MAG: hypothetical protein ACRD2N_14080, partial [Vicinamibacterales bacterium]